MSLRYAYCGNWDFKGELKGIHAFSFDARAGALQEMGVYGEQCGQSILALMNGFLLSVCELGRGGHVVSYSVEDDGALLEKDVLDFDSAKLSYIAADPKGAYVFVSSMGDGTVKMIAVDAAGRLSLKDEYKLSGHSVTKRQLSAKVHSVMPSHDGAYLAAANLGADEIDLFSIDREKERLQLISTLPIDWGKEPRHMAFSPDDKYLYLLTEGGSRLYVTLHEKGILRELASYSTLDVRESLDSAASDIVVTLDGRHIYTANRGQNNIAHWKVLDSGLLDLTGFYDSKGDSPRGLNLSPDEEEMLCVNDTSGTLTVLKRDHETGALGDLLDEKKVEKAGCVRSI